jgi:serine/threonine protein kinase
MLEIGQVVDGKYRVERLLGKGGMGAVFEGHHLLVGRRVAIKVLLPEATASDEGVARFEREVRAAARIGSEHVLEVFDVGALSDGARFMVSEFLDGETLSSRLQKGALSPREIAFFMLQLLDGLGAAHRAGIVHRDLKPDNIFLLARRGGQADFVKIIDFGVSKYQFEDPRAMSMTTTGAVIGTPYYLSPEQAKGQRDIDARSDLYTVGVIMFEAVAGNLPVSANTFNELLFKIALEPAPPLTRDAPGVDPAFSKLVEKTMANDREARFQTADDLAHALESWLATAGHGALSRKEPELPAASSGVETKPEGTPTSSSFGRTATTLGARRRFPRALLVATGIGLLTAVGLAARLLSTNTAPTGVPSSSPHVPSLNEPVASQAPVPVVAPVEPEAVAAPSAVKEPVEPEPTPQSSSRVSTPRGAPRTVPSRPASKTGRAAATIEPPATTSTARKRRDFGY